MSAWRQVASVLFCFGIGFAIAAANVQQREDQLFWEFSAFAALCLLASLAASVLGGGKSGEP